MAGSVHSWSWPPGIALRSFFPVGNVSSRLDWAVTFELLGNSMGIYSFCLSEQLFYLDVGRRVLFSRQMYATTLDWTHALMDRGPESVRDFHEAIGACPRIENLWSSSAEHPRLVPLDPAKAQPSPCPSPSCPSPSRPISSSCSYPSPVRVGRARPTSTNRRWALRGTSGTAGSQRGVPDS